SMKRSTTCVAWLLGVLGAAACGDDGDPNGQPTTTTTTNGDGETTVTTTEGPTTEGTTMTMETTGPAPDVTAGTTDGEPTVMLPATYRFDCLDVIEMGDGDGDGQPDGSAIQAVLLENTWMADIEEFRLSVLLTVLSR